ncbi:hypothetical protein LWI29_001205 [Acer saccharum]|uniref:Pentatricopeptide repeat-containing protein n=1 Tax=Acer saccharum TaxID=4024 RepID=A0AA39SQ79_ACESA|nr:hypothetical protein LWI29_001205 [Acer saccharum]
MRGEDSGIVSARRLFDDICERNVVAWNTLLKGYVRCGDINGAQRVFDEMPQRNVVSWTTMISGCAHNGGCVSKRCLGNGSEVLINRAFRTAIKGEVALTLEKAENEVLGHDVVNTILQRKLTRTIVGNGSIEGH